MKSWILALLLAVIAVAPVAYFTYNLRLENNQSPSITTIQFEEKQRNLILEQGSVFGVLSVKVIDGYKFGLYLEGGKYIEAHLSTATKEEAVPIVIELLNNTTPPPPTVTLLRKVGNYWIVDFQLTSDNQRVNLLDVLRGKKLLLQ